MKAWYKVVQDLLVENGIAVRHPDFDENKPYDEPVKILHPKYLSEWAETRFLLEQSKDTGKTTQDKRVVPKKCEYRVEDPTKKRKYEQCEALSTKTSRAFSGVGGTCSLGDGTDLPGMSVLAAEGLKEEWDQRDSPVSRMWDQKNSRFAPAFVTANTKGRMKGGLTGEYLKSVFSICWPIADRPLDPDPVNKINKRTLRTLRSLRTLRFGAGHSNQ